MTYHCLGTKYTISLVLGLQTHTIPNSGPLKFPYSSQLADCVLVGPKVRMLNTFWLSAANYVTLFPVP